MRKEKNSELIDEKANRVLQKHMTLPHLNRESMTGLASYQNHDCKAFAERTGFSDCVSTCRLQHPAASRPFRGRQ